MATPADFLLAIAPLLSLLLIITSPLLVVLGGILFLYGSVRVQLPGARKKWQTAGMLAVALGIILFVSGIVVAAISGAASAIPSGSLLQPV